MTHRTARITLYIGVILLLSLSCSKPENLQDNLITSPGVTMPAVQNDTGSATNNHYLWAYYAVYINPEHTDYEMVPVRQTANHFNVLKFLDPPNCADCFTIQSITPSGFNTILVNFQIKHPFPTLAFSGFDVKGIMMFDGAVDFPTIGVNTSSSSNGEGELLNADGYTTLYNPTTIGSGPAGLQGYFEADMATSTTPSSSLNGYKNYFTPALSNNRHAFYGGDTETVQYEIHLPSGPFVFGYAVDGNWVPAGISPVTDPSADFPPEANAQEAWAIDVEQTPYGSGLSSYGGKVRLTVDIYDYEGSSSYKIPVAECPDLFAGTKTLSLVSENSEYARYTVDISNSLLAGEGDYKCLIRVEENANDTSPEWLDLSAYQIVDLHISKFTDSAPEAFAKASGIPGTVCVPIDFADDGSYDPDGGEITKYQWNWDNDGTWDEEGKSVSHTWDTPGTYIVRFRVTDDEGTGTSLATPMSIIVNNSLPFASASADKYSAVPGNLINFSGIGSHDTDCSDTSVTQYDWDWENDGTFDDTGINASHSYSVADVYEVQLRVTDNEGGTDLLDTPLEITVGDHGWTRAFGSLSGAVARCVDTDEDGNVYIGGDFIGTVDFDPGPGVTTRVAAGFSDSYIAKYDRDGNFQWVRRWGGTSPDTVNDICVSQNGELYACGFFASSVQFDEAGNSNTYLPNEISGYLVKYGTDGTYAWDRVFWSATGTCNVYGLTPDPAGGVFTCGAITGTNVYIGFHPYDSVGQEDPFIARFDQYGSTIWAITFGGASTDTARDLIADGSSNIVVIGDFAGTADFDPTGSDDNRISAGLADVFISKFDSSGNRFWTKTFPGTGADIGYEVVLFPSGSIFACGEFRETINLNPDGVDNHTSNGISDAFLVKLTQDGDFAWGHSWGGLSFDGGAGIAASPSGNVIISGRFSGVDTDLDPGPGEAIYTALGTVDIYVSEFNASGVFQWTAVVKGSYDQAALDSTFDPFGNVITTGVFSGTADFDPNDGEDFHSASSQGSIFIQKLMPYGDY